MPQRVGGGVRVEADGPHHAHQLPLLHLLPTALQPPLVGPGLEVGELRRAGKLTNQSTVLHKLTNQSTVLHKLTNQSTVLCAGKLKHPH